MYHVHIPCRIQVIIDCRSSTQREKSKHHSDMLTVEERNLVNLQKRNCFDWFARRVKFKFVDDELPEPENPTPVFPGLDYTKGSPNLDNNNEFFNDPTGYRDEAIRLSLHIFFSLPARGLDDSGIKKRTWSQTEMVKAVSESNSVHLYKTSNNDITAHTLLHRVVMSEDSEQMNFDETYQKMNHLVKGADEEIRCSFWKKAAPFQADSIRGPENTKEAFAAILYPIINLFGELWRTHLDFNMGSTSYDYNTHVDEKDMTKYTNFSVRENGEPFVCIIVKYPSINIEDAYACSDVLTQAVSQCIYSETPYGVVTDYVSTLCFKLELEEQDIKSIKKSTYTMTADPDQSMFKYVKISYMRVKHDASVNTLSCVLAAHIFNAREDMLLKRDDYRARLSKLGVALKLTSKEMIIRDQKSHKGLLNNIKRPEKPKKITFTVNKISETVNLYDTIPFDESNMTIIQAGDSFNAQVLEINESVFKRLTVNVRHTGNQPGTSRYLLKFFDPVHGRKVHKDFTLTEKSYWRLIKHTFFRELVMYRQLKSLWGKCIPRLYHAGICHLSSSGGSDIRFGGLFLIIEFIEGKRPDFSREEIQQSARDALKDMHDLGAVHGDISSRNMIQHEDQVFLLDFGLSNGKTYKKTGAGGGLKDLKIKDQEALEKAILKY